MHIAGPLRTLLVAVCGLGLALAATPAGAQTEQVLRAQERLEALGLSPGPIDGVMGDLTQEALREFQRKNDLPVTGELDWQTRTALAATVRSAPTGSSAPVPRAVPVPDVAISALPAPGTAPTESDAPAPPMTVAVETPEPPAGAAPADPAVDTLAAAAARNDGQDPEAASAPAGRSGGDPLRQGLIAGLGLIAAGAAATMAWWLRWWSRPAKPDENQSRDAG